MNSTGGWGVVLNSIIYAVLGVVIYAGGFIIIDKLTPYALWKEIVEKQNVALAVLLGAVAIGLALVISAAIHG
jgi:putative membrane protein